jgi:hypothetical protein
MELQDSGAECAKLGERTIFTLKSKAIERPSVASDGLVQSVDRKIVEDGDSVFQKFRANFHKLYALFCVTAKLSYHNVGS